MMYMYIIMMTVKEILIVSLTPPNLYRLSNVPNERL